MRFSVIIIVGFKMRIWRRLFIRILLKTGKVFPGSVYEMLHVFQEREQFALVFSPTQAKSALPPDELVGEHFSVENYEVGLVVTTCSRTAASEADQQQLHLRFWLVLTNQRELFPRLSLDSRHGLMTQISPHSSSLSDGM